MRNKNTKANRPNPSDPLKVILLGKSGGLCEFRGCGEYIWKDTLTNNITNFSNIAHIIANSPNWVRGDATKSQKELNSPENLMILCQKHHKEVDDEKNGFTVEDLKEMKKEHEEFIEELLKTKIDSRVNVIKYCKNIADRTIDITDEEVRMCTMKNKVWCKEIINLSNSKMDERDSVEAYKIEQDNLEKLFNQRVKPLLEKDENAKFYVFGIAPQPNLIHLGTLMSDIIRVEVQQKQREPKIEWYLDDVDNVEFNISTKIPKVKNKKVALNLSFSGDIDDSRIISEVGEGYDIIKIESNIKGTDIIKSKKQLEQFRIEVRRVFEYIKDNYGRNSEINVFPALPVSLAVELGRCWMKKAHPKMVIFDEKNGFKKALEIEYKGDEQ